MNNEWLEVTSQKLTFESKHVHRNEKPSYLTIIPRTRVRASSVVVCHLISNKGEWNNCFIKNNQDLADFMFQERPEDDLMASISRAWYND